MIIELCNAHLLSYCLFFSLIPRKKGNKKLQKEYCDSHKLIPKRFLFKNNDKFDKVMQIDHLVL